VFKGMRMAGHMGAKRVTQVGLTIVDRDPEQNLLLVKGAIPGHRNSLVVVREEKRR
jgi:large subunit ribosomal protein L3